ncbi:MAG TPA: ArsR family transcriptional regulator [Microbacterium sp.]|jgi:protein-tyrosine-phosphatase/DNA-binding transcriptional ArsR family regulator|uniref:Helix-turn-helix domain-containing protein n=2 Tax=Microbacterium TaxID=33882 RepID=A0A7S8N117_9MICO|nr:MULTISPECIES: helix-turn-helix domain-containing protein [Microbacterium]MAY48316.1 ArsR family transcriptional regulator [Microbacterium sp.]MBU20984.1 ArsR family transcriptional regulator [Microbacterium sp.]MCC4267668.1 helix-turn-helix domain-containing protein [Microbacterium schleiferi]OJV94136.1 MAG: ArsR family transcriptional regulator [Microbacterium sp. 67-17]QPE06030.1 helix-turn-helix domain-containing protein [Microbacterium schleiferi]|tara:strand:+ start:6223 stop:6900 length:678 start_codon:yes stop_codon:yes gene_type:complete
MNIEETCLAGRVARYAALADPVRLRIVDLLTLGDVAPVELQGELGVSSSLLAHHLNQLEQAGLIVRTRSEADRRRTYLHLAPGALDGLTPSPMLGVRRVVFVCTGNSARSQLAAALWHGSSDIPVASAGTHPAAQIEPGAIAAADRHGLTLRARAPRALDDVLGADDFVVTVCDTAHEELGDAGCVHWSVPDPVRDGTDAAFDAAFEDIAARIQSLAPRLTTTKG